VRRFLASVPAHDPQASLAAWAADGLWSFAVGGDYSATAHTFEGAPHWNPAQLVAMHTAVQNALREPLTLDIYTIIGEGSYVGVEAVGIMVRKKDGSVYRQHYGMVFKMRRGKIVEVHEYQDTLHQYVGKLDHRSDAPVTPPSSNANE
jgi:ketosteroid isomerase-like protein